jgi:hypothetical protein
MATVTTITTTITTEDVTPASFEIEGNDMSTFSHVRWSDSLRKNVLIRDMNPYHLFNAIKKDMATFCMKDLVGASSFREMCLRMAEYEPEE